MPKHAAPKLRFLRNGIPVAWIDHPTSTSCAIEVFCKVGSRYETPEVSGASHFLEHMLFKGTKKRPAPQAVSRDLDRYGADFNASTGKDQTSYYVKIDASKTLFAIDILHDMLTHSTMKSAEFERERGVIIEEINMYEDNPQSQMADLLDEMAFGKHPLGWNIAGTRDSIRALSREALVAYKEAHYRADTLVIALAGKIPAGAWKTLEATFGAWKLPKMKAGTKTKTHAQGVVPVPFVRESMEGVRLSFQPKNIEQVQLGMAFLTYPMFDPRQDALRLLACILGGTMSSRLFTEVREKRGLCYSIRAGRSTYQDISAFQIMAGLEKKSLKQATEVIWEQLEGLQKTLVSKDELQRAKDFLRGKFMLDFEDPLTQADWYGSQLCFREAWTSPTERMKRIERVTSAQIREVAREIFTRSSYAVSVVGPFGSAEEFEGIFRS